MLRTQLLVRVRMKRHNCIQHMKHVALRAQEANF
jgi:hypothetical protein